MSQNSWLVGKIKTTGWSSTNLRGRIGNEQRKNPLHFGADGTKCVNPRILITGMLNLLNDILVASYI